MQRLDQLVTKTADRSLEITVGLSRPICVLLNSVIHRPWKCDVQHIILIMTVVSGDPGSVAGGGESNAGFTNKWWTVVTVRVTPDTVYLH